MNDISKGQAILEGTIAQALGGSLASTIVIGMASFDVYMAAGFESAFGTLIGIVAYIGWKITRNKTPEAPNA